MYFMKENLLGFDSFLDKKSMYCQKFGRSNLKESWIGRDEQLIRPRLDQELLKERLDQKQNTENNKWWGIIFINLNFTSTRQVSKGSGKN